MRLRDRFLDKLLPPLCGLSLASCFLLLSGIVGYIIYQGAGAISWEFLTTMSAQAGSAGGILYQILGTLILGLATIVIVSPLAYGVALLQCFFLRSHNRVRRLLSLFVYSLNGFPSILFGLFGFFLFVKFFGWGKSWLAGSILLAFVSLPTVTVSIIERIKEIPPLHVEAAYALGFKEERVALSIVIPQSLGGYFTGLLLGIARAVGETAPILFTATVFAGATFPTGVKDSPIAALPYHLFVLAQDSYDQAALTNGWGAALVLVGIVFLLSFLALPARLIIRGKQTHE